MAITKRTRYEVLRRDDHTCRYCGGRAPDVILTVDHVIPRALGGTDDPANLVAACKDCNAGKAATNPDAPLVAQVTDDALRWAEAMRVAVDDWLAVRADAKDYADVVFDHWCSESDIYRYSRANLPDSWEDSVEKWRTLGVPVEMVVDAISIAMRRRTVQVSEVWRYACGVVWSRLSELQETARQKVAPAPDPDDGDESEDWWNGFTRGCVVAFRNADRRFSAFQFEELCRVTDATAMAEMGRA